MPREVVLKTSMVLALSLPARSRHSTGEVPAGAEVTAEQAESALGRTMATELDGELPEAADADTTAEEEALTGHQVNPTGVDYSCVSWQPTAPSTASMDENGMGGKSRVSEVEPRGLLMLQV